MGVWLLLRRVQREEALEPGGVWTLVGEGWDPERMDLGVSEGEVAREGPRTLGKEWFLLGSGGGEKEYQKVHLELAEEEDLEEDLEEEGADIDEFVRNNMAPLPYDSHYTHRLMPEGPFVKSCSRLTIPHAWDSRTRGEMAAPTILT
jgi:hypothetical protein